MGTISRYIEYFRKITQEHPDTNSFYMMDINEPLDARRSTIKYPALILTSLSGSFEASNLDNILDSVNGGFMILGHIDQVNNFFGEIQLVSKMKQIGADVIARMLHDHMKCELLALKASITFVGRISFKK